MSRRQWTGLFFWFAAVSRVAGQTSNVTACVPSFEWSLNSLQQTPCIVAAYLESACGVPTSVDSIPVDTHYLGPTLAEADPCRCNSVTYSMVSACGGCQNRTFTTYTTWIEDCPSASSTFPQLIPNNVVVPPWAYLNLSQTNNTFSVSAAQEDLANTPTPTTSSAISTSTSVSTGTSSSALSSTSSTSASAGKSRSNAGAIAGGVVGGLVLLAIIGLTVLWFILRKRRNAIQKDLSFDSRALVSGQQQQSMTTGTTNGPPAVSSQSIYTSDMSTFPGSPLTTSGVFTTIPPSRRSLESVSFSVAQLGGGSHVRPAQGGYTGMPEI